MQIQPVSSSENGAARTPIYIQSQKLPSKSTRLATTSASNIRSSVTIHGPVLIPNSAYNLAPTSAWPLQTPSSEHRTEHPDIQKRPTLDCDCLPESTRSPGCIDDLSLVASSMHPLRSLDELRGIAHAKVTMES